MTLYRISLELQSSLVTPLKGDTIWGHIVWGIANHEGDEAVSAFLKACAGDEPALITSSAFPSGFICRPLPIPKERTEKLTKEKYTEIKKEKKRAFVPASDFFQTQNKIPDSDEQEKANAAFQSVELTHNTINRETGTVLEKALFSVEEHWAKIDKHDIYITSTLDAPRVKELFEWAFENGYGADASTGKGVIKISGEPEKLTVKYNGNKYMALGPFVGCGGISDLRSDIFLRTGKTGGALNSVTHPYKKPVLLYKEGAVFNSEKKISYIGKLLPGMHGEDDRICQSGFAPVIAIDDSEANNE